MHNSATLVTIVDQKFDDQSVDILKVRKRFKKRKSQLSVIKILFISFVFFLAT